MNGFTLNGMLLVIVSAIMQSIRAEQPTYRAITSACIDTQLTLIPSDGSEQSDSLIDTITTESELYNKLYFTVVDGKPKLCHVMGQYEVMRRQICCSCVVVDGPSDCTPDNVYPDWDEIVNITSLDPHINSSSQLRHNRQQPGQVRVHSFCCLKNWFVKQPMYLQSKWTEDYEKFSALMRIQWRMSRAQQPVDNLPVKTTTPETTNKLPIIRRTIPTSSQSSTLQPILRTQPVWEATKSTPSTRRFFTTTTTTEEPFTEDWKKRNAGNNQYTCEDEALPHVCEQLASNGCRHGDNLVRVPIDVCRRTCGLCTDASVIDPAPSSVQTTTVKSRCSGLAIPPVGCSNSNNVDDFVIQWSYMEQHSLCLARRVCRSQMQKVGRSVNAYDSYEQCEKFCMEDAPSCAGGLDPMMATNGQPETCDPSQRNSCGSRGSCVLGTFTAVCCPKKEQDAYEESLYPTCERGSALQIEVNGWKRAVIGARCEHAFCPSFDQCVQKKLAYCCT